MTKTMTWRRVRMSEALCLELGADRVEWGEPDKEGFYTPSLILDDALLGRSLHAAVHPSHDRIASDAGPVWDCVELVDKMVKRFRHSRAAR